MADLHTLIGIVRNRLSQYQTALKHFLAAKRIYKKEGLENDVAEMNTYIGQIYEKLEKFKESLKYYNRAAKSYRGETAMVLRFSWEGIFREREVTGNINIQIANAYQNLGRVSNNLDNNELALSYLKKAIELFKEQNMPADKARVYLNMGQVYWSMKEISEALDLYQKATRILNNIQVTEKEKYSVPALRWLLFSNIGLAHQHLKNQDKAIEYYKRSIKVIESLRTHYTEEKLKQAWQKRTKYVYERLIDLLTERGKGKLAFTYAERSKARTFLDLLAKGPQGTLENVVEEGIKTGTVKPEAIQEDVQSVVDTLPEDTAVLEYFVTENNTYLWVITGEGPSQPIVIPKGRKVLSETILKVRQRIEKGEPGGFNLSHLYDLLVAPAEDYLPQPGKVQQDEVPHLVIIPSGPLYYLPFQALMRPTEDEPEYLIEGYTVSYSPSLATLNYTRGPKLTELDEKEGTFLGLADPVTEAAPLPEARTEARESAKHFSSSNVYVGKEATEDTARSYSTGSDTVLFSTHGVFDPQNPLRSRLLLSKGKKQDGDLFAYEVFDLPLKADQVVMSACETLLPAIEDVKNQNKAIRGDDEGELTEDQLARLTTGDEVVGLTRAFISAGTPSVLSTQWLVVSKPAVELIVTYFEKLKAGYSKAGALREAQLKVINGSFTDEAGNSTPTESPLYWAPFVLYGGWGRSNAEEKSSVDTEFGEQENSEEFLQIQLVLTRPVRKDDVEKLKNLSPEITVDGAYKHLVNLTVPQEVLSKLEELEWVSQIQERLEPILN
ncbi:CHAT domain-containing protein [Candidatus Bipolaricaulota bacterium]|nr:CHAT domain-containing protein [Candidatus Bipolaricaulota bacterium]